MTSKIKTLLYSFPNSYRVGLRLWMKQKSSVSPPKPIFKIYVQQRSISGFTLYSETIVLLLYLWETYQTFFHCKWSRHSITNFSGVKHTFPLRVARSRHTSIILRLHTFRFWQKAKHASARESRLPLEKPTRRHVRSCLIVGGRQENISSY